MQRPLLGSHAIERLIGAVAFAGQSEMSFAEKALARRSRQRQVRPSRRIPERCTSESHLRHFLVDPAVNPVLLFVQHR